MSHPRRLVLSSRTSSFSRPKSLVVQVLTRNGKEAEAQQAAMAEGGQLGPNGLVQGSPASTSSSVSGLGISASPGSPSPSPSPSPIRSPASGVAPPSPASISASASGGHMPSPPKTPPGLRINVPSPGPVGGAAPPPPNYSVLPALERIHRFVITGTLQQSLFGVVKLAFDRLTKRQVAIKISRRDLSQASQARSGVTVLENVKREAQVLRYMSEHRTHGTCQKNKSHDTVMTLPSVPNISSEFSQMDISDSNGNMVDSAVPSVDLTHSPTQHVHTSEEVLKTADGEILPPAQSLQSSASFEAIKDVPCEGATYICDIVEELEDDFFHYLITEFVPGGDLYSILTTFPQHRLTESQARFVFRQVVIGVKHLHDNHIAHLDLSLENICLDANENIRIIDFGVAALHPFTPSSASTSNFFALTNASPIVTMPFIKPPQSGQTILQQFMCKPIAHLYNKPGKIRYMSPELFSNQPWDAYKNDIFSLGVILYSLLTGRPPFQHADPSDIWFQVIYSGQWLTPNIRSQPTAHVFTHLSELALNCIDQLIKPQHQRLGCDQILAHPWMQATN